MGVAEAELEEVWLTDFNGGTHGGVNDDDLESFDWSPLGGVMRAVLAGIGLAFLLSACGDGDRSLPPIEVYLHLGSDKSVVIERVEVLCEGTPERLVNVTTQGKAIYGTVEENTPWGGDEGTHFSQAIIGYASDYVQSFLCSQFSV